MDLSLQDADGVIQSARREREREEDHDAKKCTPLGWLRYYVRVGLIPGFGLFSESYLLFIFNQVGGPFKEHSPWTTCYDSERDGYVKMASLVGVVVGMVIFGLLADRMGRRLGSITTNVLMLLGAIFLAAASPAPFPEGNERDCNTFFWWIAVSYFVFGVGVGGEYPLSASIASERTMAEESSATRGRDILLCFACQGLGQNLGNAVFFFLTLGCTAKGTCSEPDTVAMNYRVSMGLSIVFLLGLLPYRLTRTESRQYEMLRNKQARQGLPTPGYITIFKQYGVRLIGTAGSWFLWDIIMYGNSLFSKEVTAQVNAGLGAVQITGYTWLYVAVALPGYFLAAFTVDRAWMGRKTLQCCGFIFVGFLFFLIGGIMPILEEPSNTGIFVLLYCLATFFYQFGPNSTTFLIPAEVYATPVRARCHGISAMSGKLGALVGEQGIAQMLNTIGLAPMFYVMGAVSLAGALLTIFLVPDSRVINLEVEDQTFVRGWLGDDAAQKFFAQSQRNMDDAVDELEKNLSVQLAETMASMASDPV